MKVLNLTEGTILLDDIETTILYSRDGIPVEIPDALARKSAFLKFALKTRMVADVTNGIPDDARPRSTTVPESGVAMARAVMSNVDHSRHIGEEDQPPPRLPQAKPPDGVTSVVWTGPATDGGGYARMNRKFMMGLADRGVNVRYEHLKSMDDMDPETNDRLRRLQAARVPSDAIKVYGMTAPLIYDWARYKMCFTMMETRRIHKDYVLRCNSADEIVVPSRWCKQVFQESGVRIPVHVVPLGVDTSIYRPGVEPISFSKNLKPFIFLSVFGWSMRKGYDVLLKAYLEEFTSDDPVTLLISSRYYGSTDESKKKKIREDVARVSSQVQNPRKPQVVLFGDVLSDAMMPRLFAAASCYVLVSRGEGFGLPYAEAGACRIPVIASRYSGHTDFLDDDNSYLVDVDEFRSAEQSLSWISYFYENAEFPVFGDVAVQQTRAHMRRVFENSDEAKAKADRLYEKITSEYNWETCVEQMHAKIDETYSRIRK